MIVPRTHIVGAGVAGLSAALAVARLGGQAILYEAAPQAGGRCRTIHPADGFAHDNGTHVLLSANRHALAFLRAVGARRRWIEAEPGGLPIYDRRSGLVRKVGLSPWSWVLRTRRPEGLEWHDLARMLRLLLMPEDCPVAAAIGERPILHSLFEPLAIAMLNTPAADASSRRLAAALRQVLRPGGGRVLVAQNGLSEDLVRPAVATLEARGVSVLPGQRLGALLMGCERVIGLALTDRTIALGPEDRVILALPPWEIARLLPALPVPRRYEPILNVHYRVSGPARPRFLGLSGALAHWALVRRDHVSVTVSAAAPLIEAPAEELAARIWRDVAPALRALGLPALADAPPEARVIKEKRATIRQAAAPLPQPPLLPLANLALAGDWIGALPATIESAVMAGQAAAQILHRHGAADAPVRRARAVRAEDAA